MTRSVYTAKYDRFRDLLTQARKQSGLTQTQVAERLARPQSFVSKYEQGERRLDVVEFLEVVHVLGADAALILRHIEES